MITRARVSALVIAVVASVSASVSAQSAQCTPTCRTGYTCADGECVELCNPPCGAGTACNANAECRPIQPTSDSGRGSSAGWARPAGSFGIVAATASALALVAGLAVDDKDLQIGLGLGVWGLLTLSVPIIASGGRSARRGTARGRVGLRVLGWISYVVSVALGGIALGLASSGEDIPASVAVPLVLLGITTELAFAVDAYASASQVTYGMP